MLAIRNVALRVRSIIAKMIPIFGEGLFRGIRSMQSHPCRLKEKRGWKGHLAKEREALFRGLVFLL